VTEPSFSEQDAEEIREPATPQDRIPVGAADPEKPLPPELGRVEFQRGINRLEREVRDQSAGLRESIGWCLLVLAMWMAWVGFLMIRQQIRGSR